MKIFLLAAIFLIYYASILHASSSSEEDDSCEGIRVTMHVWVNDTITERRKMRVTVPTGSKLYDVMVEAANKSSHFQFESIFFTSLGHFITKIGDDEQVPAENKYWMIFILNRAPKKNNPPGQAQLSPLGVSSLVVQDGKHYLFWLRNATFVHP